MASKSLITRNTRFSKFREHVRHWTLERTKDDALKIRNARCEQGRSDGGMKKFAAGRRFTDPDAAARKIVEIANDVDAVQDGRIYIERVNAPFLAVGGSGEEFRAGIERAIALGWLWRTKAGLI